jgi:hypothetical protein
MARAERCGAITAKSIAHPGPSIVAVDMTALGAFPACSPFNPRAA